MAFVAWLKANEWNSRASHPAKAWKPRLSVGSAGRNVKAATDDLCHARSLEKSGICFVVRVPVFVLIYLLKITIDTN